MRRGGPKPLVTGPGRRVGDRLMLRGEDPPLPAEVIPASAVGAITSYWQGIPFPKWCC
jgi:hypothetical protein